MNASDLSKNEHSNMSSKAMYPELKMVVTKLISHSQGEEWHVLFYLVMAALRTSQTYQNSLYDFRPYRFLIR